MRVNACLTQDAVAAVGGETSAGNDGTAELKTDVTDSDGSTLLFVFLRICLESAQQIGILKLFLSFLDCFRALFLDPLCGVG